jgi:hypothetical protein
VNPPYRKISIDSAERRAATFRRHRDQQPLHRLHRPHSALIGSRWAARRHHATELLQRPLLPPVP